MSLNLNNKTTLITGATDGLGKETALALAKLGANIIAHGRNENKALGVVAELKQINPAGEFSVLICDLNYPKTIQEKFSQITNLDILINNAGVWTEGLTTEASVEQIIEMGNVNLTSAMAITRILIPILLKSDFSQILNVISIAGEEIPTDHYRSIYTATKYGMKGFTESLVKEFDNTNLRVMGVYPDRMDTKLFIKAGIHYEPEEHRMFDPKEAVEAMIFMLTRNRAINLKRLDLLNHLKD